MELKANPLLDQLHGVLGTTTDAQLARQLGFTPCVLSHLRAGRRLSPELAIAIHETANWSFTQIYILAKDSGIETTDSRFVLGRSNNSGRSHGSGMHSEGPTRNHLQAVSCA
jgi:hypothetical protein